MKVWVGANDAPNAGKSLGEVTLHKYGHMPLMFYTQSESARN